MQVLGCFASHATEFLVGFYVDCASTSKPGHQDWAPASRNKSESAVLDQHGYGGKLSRLPIAAELCCR